MELFSRPQILVTISNVYMTRAQLMICHVSVARRTTSCCSATWLPSLTRTHGASFFDPNARANGCGTSSGSSPNDFHWKSRDSSSCRPPSSTTARASPPDFKKSEMNAVVADMCTNARCIVGKSWIPKVSPRSRCSRLRMMPPPPSSVKWARVSSHEALSRAGFATLSALHDHSYLLRKRPQGSSLCM
ncbi:hypothetical protein P7K49_009775 [Saguinus oedipus]|uniref:Uncharacterized protein n=1 Tax=Saguinus oedipus TaxID=9490 RepID=A0ABQ9VKY9_SAGOE|nr:hypothetical protein P7K49_009775 [Saguinus oedipus]